MSPVEIENGYDPWPGPPIPFEIARNRADLAKTWYA